jgi:hypothetical protein
MMATVMAAAAGDATAAARMQAFVQAMGGPSAFGLQGMPNFNDVLLAQRGDRAAMARLRMLRQTGHHQGPPKRGSTGLQTYSFLSFHPPLDKRAKRLQRMGAHLQAPLRKRGVTGKILLGVLYAVLAPLMIAAGAAILLVIALMIGLNLIFLALWLTVIHWAFAQDWSSNFQAFVSFVQQVSAAFNRGR